MKITRSDIKKWIKEYMDMRNKNGKEKYSYGARIKYLSVLKGIFHYAVHEIEVLEKSPTDRLSVPVKDSVAQSNKTKYFTLKELTTLLTFMKKYRHQRYSDYQLYYVLIYFLSESGLRISEALALRWSDIKGNKITVERQTRRNDNNQLVLTTLKNSSSYRTITLNDEVLKTLKKFKLKQNEMILKEQSFYKNKDDIIFQNYLGNYLTPSTVRESIQKYCKLAGVDYMELTALGILTLYFY